MGALGEKEIDEMESVEGLGISGSEAFMAVLEEGPNGAVD